MEHPARASEQDFIKSHTVGWDKKTASRALSAVCGNLFWCNILSSVHWLAQLCCTTRYWLHYICIRSGSIGGCPLDGSKVMVSAIIWLLSCASRIVCKVLTDKLLVSRLVLVVDVLVSRMLVADRVLASGQRGRQGTLASLHPLTLSVANSFSERRTWVQVTAVGIFINMILHCKTMY